MDEDPKRVHRQPRAVDFHRRVNKRREVPLHGEPLRQDDDRRASRRTGHELLDGSEDFSHGSFQFSRCIRIIVKKNVKTNCFFASLTETTLKRKENVDGQKENSTVKSQNVQIHPLQFFIYP